MKSDHPVLDSRYLLFEAAQAHAFGLPVRLPSFSLLVLILMLDLSIGALGARLCDECARYYCKLRTQDWIHSSELRCRSRSLG